MECLCAADEIAGSDGDDCGDILRAARRDAADAIDADLAGMLRQLKGLHRGDRADMNEHLPAAARDIPKQPPANWPTYDPAKPDTDFQLQQALVVARAMAPATRRAER